MDEYLGLRGWESGLGSMLVTSHIFDAFCRSTNFFVLFLDLPLALPHPRTVPRSKFDGWTAPQG